IVQTVRAEARGVPARIDRAGIIGVALIRAGQVPGKSQRVELRRKATIALPIPAVAIFLERVLHAAGRADTALWSIGGPVLAEEGALRHEIVARTAEERKGNRENFQTHRNRH